MPVYLTGIGGSEYQYYVKRPEGYHWSQILYSAKGIGCLKYDSQTLNLTEGYYFFLPAGYPHEYFPVSDSWDVRWIAFDGYACGHILSELNMTRPIVRKADDRGTLQRLYSKMFVAQKNDKVYGDYSCSGFVYQYIMEFYRIAHDKNMSGGNDRSNILMPVLNYIDDNFRSDFPLTVLAEKAGVSSQHLCRIFKETMNVRPMEYLTRRRLQEAKRLLTETDISVADIGFQTGFSDAGYFSTVFRKYEGVSPVEYRKSGKII
ncbi:MAG: AraC family transcriptional regulator [Oscillospiraceae bacterium]|nr:AraC family transcriptional regulator [Oscillospiraceae bacterium]